MGAVASLLAVDRTTLTAALKPLERRGLVAVAADPDDKRGRLLTLTPAGRRLLARAPPSGSAPMPRSKPGSRLAIPIVSAAT